MRRNEIRILRIFRTQERTTVAHEVAFQGRFPVDQRGYDIAVVRFAQFEHDKIALENVRAGHGIPADPHGEGPRRSPDVERIQIGIDATVRTLLARVGKSRRDFAVNRNTRHFAAVVAGDAQRAGRTGLALQ